MMYNIVEQVNTVQLFLYGRKCTEEMGVGSEVAKYYTQLGAIGAVLLILLVYTVLLFKFFSKINAASTKSVDRLCLKIDALISSNTKTDKELKTVLLSNDKDQKATLQLLTQIITSVQDIQKRISRIDDRTFGCLRTHGREEQIEERMEG